MARILHFLFGTYTNFGKQKRDTLESWINVPTTIHTENIPVIGKIKYGVRKPMAPDCTPLIECELDSKKMVKGQLPKYWFVSEQNEPLLMLPLPRMRATHDTISGKGIYSSTYASVQYFIERNTP